MKSADVPVMVLDAFRIDAIARMALRSLSNVSGITASSSRRFGCDISARAHPQPHSRRLNGAVEYIYIWSPQGPAVMTDPMVIL